MLTDLRPGSVSLMSIYLERYPEQGGPSERVAISALPFTIGRADSNDHRVYSGVVSKQHAVIFALGAECVVRDLESTNGTFVNGVRVSEQVLADGDIIHFGPVEFCFRAVSSNPGVDVAPSVVNATQALPRTVPHSMIRGGERLRELIDAEAVQMVYQPIVNLRTREVIAYEALARGTHPALTRRPVGLFQLADQCGLSPELSQLCRRLAVRDAVRLPPGAHLFLNIHPRELGHPSFVPALESLRSGAPDNRRLVLEIAEAAVMNGRAMARTRDAVTSLGFEFAYDDFGTGQARFLELADIPPHFLKLDLAIVRNIETLRPRQDVVRALLGVVRTLGVQVIAEGIETEASAATCLELGCHLGQGFLFGKPTPCQPPAPGDTAQRETT